MSSFGLAESLIEYKYAEFVDEKPVRDYVLEMRMEMVE